MALPGYDQATGNPLYGADGNPMEGCCCDPGPCFAAYACGTGDFLGYVAPGDLWLGVFVRDGVDADNLCAYTEEVVCPDPEPTYLDVSGWVEADSCDDTDCIPPANCCGPSYFGCCFAERSYVTVTYPGNGACWTGDFAHWGDCISPPYLTQMRRLNGGNPFDLAYVSCGRWLASGISWEVNSTNGYTNSDCDAGWRTYISSIQIDVLRGSGNLWLIRSPSHSEFGEQYISGNCDGASVNTVTCSSGQRLFNVKSIVVNNNTGCCLNGAVCEPCEEGI